MSLDEKLAAAQETTFEEELANRSKAQVILEAGVLVAIALMAVCGNFLIGLVVHKTRSRTLGEARFFILGLTISDLFMAVLCMPLSAGFLVTGKWNFGFFGCQLHGFLMRFLVTVSISMMALIALQRYVTVVQPLYRTKFFTKAKALFLITVTWFLIFIFYMIPAVSRVSYFRLNSGYAVCGIVYHLKTPVTPNTAFESLIVVLSAISIIYSYYKVFSTFKHHRVAVGDSPRHGNQGISAEEVKLTKSLFVILLGFVVCWVPTIIIVHVDIQLLFSLPRYVKLLTTCLIFVSSSINPVILVITNKRFRSSLLILLRC